MKAGCSVGEFFRGEMGAEIKSLLHVANRICGAIVATKKRGRNSLWMLPWMGRIGHFCSLKTLGFDGSKSGMFFEGCGCCCRHRWFKCAAVFQRRQQVTMVMS